jgi:hypothetical protein
MRYISAEQSIAAAGAAFAWTDEEFKDAQPFTPKSPWSVWLKRLSGKMMLAMAFIIA